MSKPAHVIYANQLTTQLHGFPLWDPDPQDEKPVEIADVGYFKNGAFVQLFNPADKPLEENRLGVPQGYLPFHVGKIQKRTPLPAQIPIQSASVWELQAQIDVFGGPAGGGFSFECTKEQGAVLVLGDDAERSDALCIEEFTQYFLDHHANWLTFATNIHKRGIDLSDLVFVTGCDKTSACACAAFSGKSTRAEVSLNAGQMGLFQGHASLSWTRDNCSSVAKHSGPRRSTDTGDTFSSCQSPFRDQCVFVRAYKMGDRITVMKRLTRRKKYDGFSYVIPQRKDVNEDPDASGPSRRRDFSSYPSHLNGESSSAGGGASRDTTPSGSAAGSQHDAHSCPPDSPKAGSPESELFDLEMDEDEMELCAYANCDKEHTLLDIVIEYIVENSEAEFALVHHDDLIALKQDIDSLDDFERCVREAAPRIYVQNRVGMLETTYQVASSKPRSFKTLARERHAFEVYFPVQLPPRLSRIEGLPNEIIKAIALSVVETSFLGPPAGLLPLLLLSKTIFKILSLENNSDLYARIFKSKFDICAATRRLGVGATFYCTLAHELVKRCIGLKRIRANTYSQYDDVEARGDVSLKIDLWMAYLMFIEDNGKNAAQLMEYARVNIFAFDYVALLVGGRFQRDWPVDYEVNTLAVWLFLFTDRERVHSETSNERQNILQAFCHMIFKYLCSTSFGTPPPITSYSTLDPMMPIAPPLMFTSLEHFGYQIILGFPLIIPPVLLSYTIRFEIAAGTVGEPLPPYVPASVDEVPGAQWRELTEESYDEHSQVNNNFVDWPYGDQGCSLRYDYDWVKLVMVKKLQLPRSPRAVYIPGMLEGWWTGRILKMPPSELRASLTSREAAQLVMKSPLMQFRLREHQDYPIIVSTEQAAYRNYAVQAALEMELPCTRTHEEFTDGSGFISQETVNLIGEMIGGFGQALGLKRYYGRARVCDSFVVLVYEEAGVVQDIFRGYVYGSQNLVGTWRKAVNDLGLRGWKSVWVMTKVKKT